MTHTIPEIIKAYETMEDTKLDVSVVCHALREAVELLEKSDSTDSCSWFDSYEEFKDRWGLK